MSFYILYKRLCRLVLGGNIIPNRKEILICSNLALSPAASATSVVLREFYIWLSVDPTIGYMVTSRWRRRRAKSKPHYNQLYGSATVTAGDVVQAVTGTKDCAGSKRRRYRE